jgi:hypothetical protein
MAEIGCAVQFCATIVAVELWPGAIVGGLNESDVMATVVLLEHVAAEAAVAFPTATDTAPATTMATRIKTLRMTGLLFVTANVTPRID